jgi:hypothetical protein
MEKQVVKLLDIRNLVTFLILTRQGWLLGLFITRHCVEGILKGGDNGSVSLQ